MKQFIVIEGTKMYIETKTSEGANVVQSKIDVTPVYDFLKDFFKSKYGKKLLTEPNTTA